MRTILRAILAVALLLGGGAAGWSPAQVQAHEACCCGIPAGVEDRCPCPKPEGNRGPSRGACTERQAVVASQAALRRGVPGQRRTEPRPEPATWAEAADASETTEPFSFALGREPDLGRHLARLSTFRI